MSEILEEDLCDNCFNSFEYDSMNDFGAGIKLCDECLLKERKKNNKKTRTAFNSLKKKLNNFEIAFNNASLTTDQINQLTDILSSLHHAASNKKEKYNENL